MTNKLEKRVSCTYMIMTPVPVVTSDGKNTTTTIEIQPKYHSGFQKAYVQEDRWTENIDIQIYNDSGFVELSTLSKSRAKDTVLKELSSCG